VVTARGRTKSAKARLRLSSEDLTERLREGCGRGVHCRGYSLVLYMMPADNSGLAGTLRVTRTHCHVMQDDHRHWLQQLMRDKTEMREADCTAQAAK